MFRWLHVYFENFSVVLTKIANCSRLSSAGYAVERIEVDFKKVKKLSFLFYF